MHGVGLVSGIEHESKWTGNNGTWTTSLLRLRERTTKQRAFVLGNMYG